MLEIILNSTLRLGKISITLVLLSFSFKKLQMIQCVKSSKNAQFFLSTVSAEESLSKEK